MMFVEALAALDANPSSLLVLPEGASVRSLESALIRFTDAVKAMAAHLYGHASAALARCVRAAVLHLSEQQWLQLQLRGSSSQGSGVVQVLDMEATREALKQVSGRAESAADPLKEDYYSVTCCCGVGCVASCHAMAMAMTPVLRRLVLACAVCVLCPAQSLEVLLLALSAIKRLREAAAVLKGCPQLAQLADNAAVRKAEVCALQLSSLIPSLEWPPYDPGAGSEGYDACRGTAGAMPVMQVREWHCLVPAVFS